jgi:hypothetical protein
VREPGADEVLALWHGSGQVGLPAGEYEVRIMAGAVTEF